MLIFTKFAPNLNLGVRGRPEGKRSCYTRSAMKKCLLLSLSLFTLGCDTLWGGSSLNGDWYIQETSTVFRIHSQGDRFAITFPHEELGAKGTLDGTTTYPGVLRITVPYRMAPQISATASFIANYSTTKQNFEGSYNFESTLPATSRQGAFKATKAP